MPNARPRSIVASPSDTSTGVGVATLPSRLPSKRSTQARKSSIGLDVDMAIFAIPNVRRFANIKAGAKDVHRLVAAVAIHLTVRIVAGATDNTWLPGLDREQLILHDHRRIDLGLLNLVLHSIAIDHSSADGLAELHGVEFGATYRAAVCALNPGLEAGVVQVVSTGKKMGYDFVIVIDTGTWKSA